MDDDSDYMYDDEEDSYDQEEYTEEEESNIQEDDEESESNDDPEDYTLLKEEENAKLQENDINEVSSVLCISQSAACFVLPHFNWKVTDLQDEWFADEDGIRQKAGLLKKHVVHFAEMQRLICGICFDGFNYGNMYKAACGHPFCKACWRGYVSTAIKDGPRCLMLRCPEIKCRAAVGRDLVSMVVSKQEYESYRHYLLRSYVEQHLKIKWCPAPDCKYAVKVNSFEPRGYYVSCLCSNRFCWNCMVEEIHRPVDCATVTKWMMKNKDSSQNAQWILVNTKPCPKCKRPIQKNQGCHHMTCSAPCMYEFCWYCLKKFENYDTPCCNAFRGNYNEMKDLELEQDQWKAKHYLDRYLHYYERWASNKTSKEKAIESFDEVKTKLIKELVKIQLYLSELELTFVIEAWQQIIECRQVLRWSYAYGYYIPEEDLKAKLFEHLQGQAENRLERLHKCAVTGLQPFLDSEEALKDEFHQFSIKLQELTRATKHHFQKLVTGLEKGLSEVDG